MAKKFSSEQAYLDSKSERDKFGCVVWKGIVSPDGYGRVDMRSMRSNGRKFAHRVSWALNRTPIPAGYEIDHLCRNRACINPYHLRCVTREENMKGRRHNPETHKPPMGSKCHGAKLTESQIPELRRMRLNGLKLREISAIFGVSQGIVSQVCSGIRWKHV